MKSIELFNDHFQNYKVYGIPKAQLVIADIPYNIGEDAYGSNPMWYKGGDNANGESELAGKAFFDTDKDFRIAEFMHFCSKMLRPDAKDNSEGKDIGKNGKKSGGGCVYDCILRFRADDAGYRVWRTIRLRKVYTAPIPQELFSAGIESEYASCRQYRVCDIALS